MMSVSIHRFLPPPMNRSLFFFLASVAPRLLWLVRCLIHPILSPFLFQISDSILSQLSWEPSIHKGPYGQRRHNEIAGNLIALIQAAKRKLRKEKHSWKQGKTSTQWHGTNTFIPATLHFLSSPSFKFHNKPNVLPRSLILYNNSSIARPTLGILFLPTSRPQFSVILWALNSPCSPVLEGFLLFSLLDGCILTKQFVWPETNPILFLAADFFFLSSQVLFLLPMFNLTPAPIDANPNTQDILHLSIRNKKNLLYHDCVPRY